MKGIEMFGWDVREDLGPCTNQHCSHFGKMYDGIQLKYRPEIWSSCPHCRPRRLKARPARREREMAY